jgi:3',5'-cyclic AMP phosphodiesterase CpdA
LKLNLETNSTFLLVVAIVTSIFLIIYDNHYSYALETPTEDKELFNIITAADFGCSLRAQENIKNIEKLDPDLVLVPGDLAYEKTPNCWFEMTKSLDPKIRIAIGNHDDKEEAPQGSDKLKQSYLDHYKLNRSYYSFDFNNTHVLVLDTQLELSVDRIESTVIIEESKNGDSDSKEKKNKKKENKIDPTLVPFPTISIRDLLESNSIDLKIPPLSSLIKKNVQVQDLKVDKDQYNFVINDLDKASKNSSIDWIIVMYHKPMYSSSSKQIEEFILRERYQEVFEKYDVDLVLQGHNHIYSRTLPLLYNVENVSLPIIDQANNKNNTFTNPNGSIFLVVGTGGKELYRLLERPSYVANDYNEGFGFLDLKIFKNKLLGVFYDIGLVCDTIITEKKKKEVMDLESCKPKKDTDKLKVIDYFSITK